MTATKITPGLITTLVGATGLPASAGYEFVSSVTASGDSTISFTNMTTGYDWKYELLNVLLGTDNVYFDALVGIAGPTYRTSSYLDQQTEIWGHTASVSRGQQTAKIRFYSYGIGNAADEGTWFTDITFFDPANSAIDTVWSKKGMYTNSSASESSGYSGGHYTTAEAHTSIQFSASSGTIASGTFKQYRRANA